MLIVLLSIIAVAAIYYEYRLSTRHKRFCDELNYELGKQFGKDKP
jgi:hypothetical protein